MDNCFFISRLCLTALIAFGGFVQAEDEINVKFNLTDKIVYSKVGAENFQMKCVLNQGPLYIVENKLLIIHQHPITKVERLMASGAVLEEGAPPEFYDVQFDKEGSTGDEFHIIFTIKSVRDVDDGPFICKAVVTDTQKEAVAEFEFIVVRDIKNVELQFDGHPPVTEKPADPIEIDSGTYPVSCTATGSNPGAEDVKLYLDGNMMATSDVSVVISNDTEYRTYLSSVTAQVDINVHSSGKDLQCVAQGKYHDAVTSELSIKVNTYDPEVMCNNSQAHEGQMYPILKCTVNHTDIEIDSFAFQIGKTGEIINDGGANADSVAVKSEKISEDITEVSLNLHKAQNWHFDKDFYILITSKGGHVTKEIVVLNKIEKIRGETEIDDDDNNMANVMDGKLALALSFLMGLLVQLL